MIAALVALADFGGGFEQANGFEEKVVEVDGVVLAELVLVGAEDVRYPFARWIFRTKKKVLRIDHVIFSPGDAALHSARGELLGIEAHALHDLLDQRRLIVLVKNCEGASEALAVNSERLDVAAKDAHAKGMEGCDERFCERRVTEQLIDAFGHFGGGFIGEGDGEDGIGRDVFLLDEPGDAMGDNAGFAGAGSCEDEQGALGGFDSGALFGIEIGEKGVQSERS